ncbi:CLUMA_CG005512, isoform A [Clunio marinus]|uniref:Ubiquitin carboxyl-terminal hydrolase n=1 Tax=Clunio marinus TaxID=568069 RepID=A0A1J1HX10_9DIPT|nr:CLUMA_CG005512, isoform A [Clunio marinus]
MASSFVIPLESNPDVLNKYLEKLGVASKYDLVDVFGLDDDGLNCVPRPTKALILLFPVSDAYEEFRKKQDVELSAKPPTIPENLFFVRQYVRNSCGTMALVHAVLNNLSSIELKDDSVMKKFYEKAKELTPEERGRLLEQNSAFIEIHQALAEEGQTAAPPSDEIANKHFITLVSIGNELFELDGSKNFPVSHGATSDEKFLFDAARVCKEFMARDPKELNFTIMAYANAQ